MGDWSDGPPPPTPPRKGEGSSPHAWLMHSFRDFLSAPWRAVAVLGVTQITAWGAIFYTPVLIVPLIAADRGWSISFAMGGFSLGLLTAGIAARYVGSSIDRVGGHVTMTCGSLA